MEVGLEIGLEGLELEVGLGVLKMMGLGVGMEGLEGMEGMGYEVEEVEGG